MCSMFMNGGGARVLDVHEWAQHTCDFQVGYLYFRKETEDLIHKKSTFPKLLAFPGEAITLFTFS